MAESNDPRVNKDLEEARNGTSIANLDALTHMLTAESPHAATDGSSPRSKRKAISFGIATISCGSRGQYRKALARARRLKEMQAELGLEEDEVGRPCCARP